MDSLRPVNRQMARVEGGAISVDFHAGFPNNAAARPQEAIVLVADEDLSLDGISLEQVNSPPPNHPGHQGHE